MTRSRTSSGALLALLALLGTACVDAPITPDQVEADGQLRAPGLKQSAFSAQERSTTQRAAQISAVLAAQADGPLEDANRFPADVGEINLHLRADGIDGQRPVVFRWTHRGDAALVPGTLTPGDTMGRATSFHIDPELVGPWKVEILGAPVGGDEPVVLFERSFEIFVPSR
ncbi:MAG: hypothetical protein H6712_31375 [Myxococcales bacterium]|nr:hypothetical protein [Myxococcales bacterium]MCB9718392.1 hypothetical protein [Myxococcales bacterium]